MPAIVGDSPLHDVANDGMSSTVRQGSPVIGEVGWLDLDFGVPGLA